MLYIRNKKGEIVLQDKLLKYFSSLLLVIFVSACGGHKPYWVTIKKDGNLTAINNQEIQSLLDKTGHSNIDKYISWPNMVRIIDIKPSIGIFIQYKGYGRPYGGLMEVAINIYSEHQQKKDMISFYDNPLDSTGVNSSLILITKEILSALKVFDEDGNIKDGLIIESADQVNKKIPYDDYIIKLSKEELSSIYNQVKQMP